MSLTFFHILFITVSTLLALFVAVWALDSYRADGSAAWLGLALLAVAGGGLLVVYANRFMRKARKLVVAALIAAAAAAAPTPAAACAVCLGNTSSPLRDGMNAGILALLGFALFMIVSFAAFFVYLWRRSKAAADTSSEGEPAHA